MLRKPREDRGALVERLYDQHGVALYRYAVMLLGEHAAAEDVIQQVFAALLRHDGPIDNEVHYLRRAVRNESFSTLRKRKVRSDTERPLLEPAADRRIDDDERITLERALLLLPDEQREVVHLHVFEGMTFQEVAATTGESINTAASRYRYALAKLRQVLRPEKSDV